MVFSKFAQKIVGSGKTAGADVTEAYKATGGRTASGGSSRINRGEGFNPEGASRSYSTGASSNMRYNQGASSQLETPSFAKQASRNFRGNIAKENGLQSMGDVTGGQIAGAIASDVGKGAVGGGAIGGTMEAAQGGSFWEGAKSGAMNGAMAWGGYKSARRATNDSMVVPGAMKMQREAPGGGVSKSVKTLMQSHKDSNVARNMM